MAYTNSSLVSYTRLVSNHSGQRNHAIDRITPHCVVGQCSLQTLGNIFSDSSRETSANYGIDPDGKIGMYVQEKDRSWCSSSSSNDHRAVTIEVASDSFDPYKINDNAYAALVKLCEDICRRNGKKRLLWLKNKTDSLNYSPKADEMIITVHRWFANKSCPGDWLYNRLDQLASAVTSRLAGSTNINTLQFVDYTIDYKKLSPYIAELSTKSPRPNWAKLKSHGVSGSLIYAGALFSKTHRRQDVFRDIKAYDHVRSSIDAGLPFGYYMPVRAQTTVEAREEMYELSFLVRKYPPRLGVWLQLELGGDKTFKDNMIKIYQEELVRLGLKSKIGFRLTKSSLSIFSWDKFQNDWGLWLTDKISNIDGINTLLTPEFFDTDGKSG